MDDEYGIRHKLNRGLEYSDNELIGYIESELEEIPNLNMASNDLKNRSNKFI